MRARRGQARVGASDPGRQTPPGSPTSEALPVFGATSTSSYTDRRSLSKEEEKPKHRPQESHLASPVLAPEWGPKSPAGAMLGGARGTPGPGPTGCPQGPPGRGHGALLGREARRPVQALPHWAGSRTIRRGPLGTVGAWQQQGCPCQGMLLATLPGAGGTPKPHPPRMEALPRSLPPATPQPRASRGTSRVLPRHLGPANPTKGSARAAGLLRLPQVPITPARGWEGPGDWSRGGGGGGVRRAAPEGVPAPGSTGCHLCLQGRRW